MAALTLSAAMFLGCNKKEDADSTALELSAFGSAKIAGVVYAEQDGTPDPTTSLAVKKGLAGVKLVFSIDYSDYDMGMTGTYTGIQTYVVTTAADGSYSLNVPVPANGGVNVDLVCQTLRANYVDYTAPVNPGDNPVTKTEVRDYDAAGAPAQVGVFKNVTTTQDIEYVAGAVVPYTVAQ